MRVLGFLLLAGCYSPSLEPCLVRCDSAAPCPDDLTCGDDQYCHAPGDEEPCTSGNVFTLEITRSGTGIGTVIGDADIDCGSDCKTAVTGGTRVTLEARPALNSRFAGFGGECTGQDPCIVIVSTDKTIDAKFNRSAQLELAFIGGGLGHVGSEPAGIDCTTQDVTCVADFDLGSTVVLTATPDIDFLGWQGDCAGFGVALDCSLEMTVSRSVGAEFQ